MDVLRISEGLWRWTAPHPDWKPGEEWARDVGCVYYEAPDAVVLIDPLVPEGEEERFWEALDRDVERVGRPVWVLLTVQWHERSIEIVTSRYGATSWRRGGGALPAGVEAIDAAENGESVFWIPEHAAIVPGDTILGEPEGIRVCPLSWLPDGADAERFLAELDALLELPADRLLVSHGEPVLQGGRAALERALAQAHQSSATDR